MTLTDPFATAPAAPAPDEAQTAPETAPEQNVPTAFGKPVGSVKVKVEPDFQGFDSSKIVLTFKEGTGFDSSWVVVHAASVDEADAVLDQKFADLLAKTKKVAGFFRGGSPAASNNSGGQRPVQAGQPQGSVEPPAWFPAPPAPDWVYKTGFSAKTNSTWHAWAPARKGEGEWEFHKSPK